MFSVFEKISTRKIEIFFKENDKRQAAIINKASNCSMSSKSALKTNEIVAVKSTDSAKRFASWNIKNVEVLKRDAINSSCCSGGYRNKFKFQLTSCLFSISNRLVDVSHRLSYQLLNPTWEFNLRLLDYCGRFKWRWEFGERSKDETTTSLIFS